MTEPIFFRPARGLTVGDIVALTGAEAGPGSRLDQRIDNIAALDRAGPTDLTFLDNVKYADRLAQTRAGACLMTAQAEALAPSSVTVLRARHPFRAFVTVARELFPGALRPSSLFEAGGVVPGTSVHPTARLEDGVVVDPGAVIGPRAEIGSGTVIGAGSVIGPDVRIGRNSAVGAGASLTHALVGDRVIIHPGCRIGQDGFGFVMGQSHAKIPQIGRVIIQDDVEIGAGTTIDRGNLSDTTIGEGTKIDNQVQIGHNVSIGRHCVIVAQCGISGSVTLEDYVVLAGKVGIADHLTIGEGAQIGAGSGIMSNVPAGEKWFGYPALKGREYLRRLITLRPGASKESGAQAAPAKQATTDDRGQHE